MGDSTIHPGAIHTLAAVHVSLWIALPMLIGAWTGIVLLWRLLGASHVPDSRRRIRRASLVVAIALSGLLVLGASVVDPAIAPRRYAEVWTVAFAFVALLVLAAVADAANTLRLHAEEAHDQRIDTLLRARRSMPKAPGPDPLGAGDTGRAAEGGGGGEPG